MRTHITIGYGHNCVVLSLEQLAEAILSLDMEEWDYVDGIVLREARRERVGFDFHETFGE